MTPSTQGDRAHAAGLIANIGLAAGKLAVGWGAGSQALLADAANSVGDIAATAVGWLAFRFAQRPADDDHHYGHGNVESLAGLGVGLGIAATGLGITWSAIEVLRVGSPEAPGLAAAGAAAVTLVTKAALAVYVSRVGSALGSPTLLASAADHRADVLASAAVGAAVLGARAGFPWLDPATGAALGLWIVWLAVPTIRDNLGVLLDEAQPEVAEGVRAIVCADPDVRAMTEVRVHPLGASTSVQIVIEVDPGLTVAQADTIRGRLLQALREHDPHILHVAVVVHAHGPRRPQL